MEEEKVDQNKKSNQTYQKSPEKPKDLPMVQK